MVHSCNGDRVAALFGYLIFRCSLGSITSIVLEGRLATMILCTCRWSFARQRLLASLSGSIALNRLSIYFLIYLFNSFISNPKIFAFYLFTYLENLDFVTLIFLPSQ